MLDIAAIVLMILSALFPSVRLEAKANGNLLHLSLAQDQKQPFQVHLDCTEPTIAFDGKLGTSGPNRSPEGKFTETKITPAPGAMPAIAPQKLNLDAHFRPLSAKSEAPWLDLVSLMGGLPKKDLSVGKPYPYKCKIGNVPVSGTVIFKGTSGADLQLVATGKATMDGQTFAVYHELLFPRSGGPVREIRIKIASPKAMTIRWSAKRVP